jgi:hypothetical protein
VAAVAENNPGGPSEADGSPGPAIRLRQAFTAPGRGGGYLAVAWLGAALVVLLLALMVVRLPWDGDLGIHAATLERLRHDLTDPGDPLVDADVPSPYYSPWMVLLALVAKATGLGTFGTLRIAAVVGLVTLVTGIAHFVRTFTKRPAAVPLAILCVTLLYGWTLFSWSGFPGLTSLALCIAYPSTLALGLAFHLWALLRKALARDWKLTGYLGLGVLLGVQLLVHQFTGVVTVLGLLAIVLGARPWPTRAVWLRIAAAVVVTAVILLVWPYYSFFGLWNAGNLDPTHQPLYTHLVTRFGLMLLGVAALVVRFRRDRRDPLVLLFVFGAVIFAVGGVTGHYSLGRILPAVFFSAQIALAIEAADGGGIPRVRQVFAPLTAVALLIGLWAQVGSLSFVVGRSGMPPVLSSAPAQKLWTDYSWIKPHVAYGDVIMTNEYYALHQAPAYGVYTVESGYPDFFLSDQTQRAKDTKKFFAKTTSAAERQRLIAEYHVKWIIVKEGAHRAVLKTPSGETVATGRI